MIDIKQQEEMLIAVGNILSEKISVYAIGGTAMMLRGIKNTTLDIDFVFDKKRDREKFMEALKKLGAKESDVTLVYGLKRNTPLMMEFQNCRFDMFMNKVINSVFSDEMKKRAEEIHEFGNLVIKAANTTDIFIMKSVTSRVKDEEDIINLISSHKINWQILTQEAENQVKLGNETAVLYLGTLLEKLKDKHKINIPKEVLDALWKLLKKQIKSKADKKR